MIIKTKKLIMTCGFLLLPLAFLLTSTAHASEVTGTLSSSGASGSSTTTGSISGGVGSGTGGTIGGGVGSGISGSIGGGVGSGVSGTISGGTGNGGSLSGTVVSPSTGSGSGGGGTGGGGNGPIVQGTGGGNGGTGSGNGSIPGGVVLGASTSTVGFPETGFGPYDIPWTMIGLGILGLVLLTSLAAYVQKKREHNFSRKHRITNWLDIGESIFS
jgi:hypothetical protein